MLKKNLTLAAILIIVITTYGQIVNKDYDSKEFQTLLKSELNVILTGEEAYDENIKTALEKYWEITNFKFITSKEALYEIKDETKSFLLPLKVQMYKEEETRGVKSDVATDSYKYWISIVIGGKSKVSRYTDDDAIALSPFNLWCGEKKPRDAAFRLDYIIKGLNDGIAFIRDNQFKGGYSATVSAVIDNINSNASIIKEKTLIINKDAEYEYKNPIKTTKHDVYKEKILEKEYPYKYELVDENEFLEILAGNSNEYLCLLTIVEVNKHIHIYEPSTRKTIYYGWEMRGFDFDKGDINDLLEYKK